MNEIIQGLFVLSAAWLSGRYLLRKERIATSRKIFEKSYSQIFQIIEYDLYSKDIKLEKVKYYGVRIIEVFERSNLYYYPSLKVYAERLRDANKNNYMNLWSYFSLRFDIEYDRVCRIIKVPIRTRVYRLSRKHYQDKKHFWRIYFFSGKEAVIDTISILVTLILLLLLLQNK